jgi:hypothetical protein
MIFYFVIGIVVFLTYKIYIWTRCPKELKNVPALPLLTFLKFNLDKRGLKEKMDTYYQPFLNEHGVVRVCHKLCLLYNSCLFMF